MAACFMSSAPRQHCPGRLDRGVEEYLIKFVDFTPPQREGECLFCCIKFILEKLRNSIMKEA